MPQEPSEQAVAKMRRFVESYCAKSGTTTHPDAAVTEGVIEGLAAHSEQLGRPLCPCRFYPDKQAELEHRTWICACDDMQIYKYCHCLLFVNAEGQPQLSKAQGPVRVAISGRTVGPPLWESLAVLGRERTLVRLRTTRARIG